MPSDITSTKSPEQILQEYREKVSSRAAEISKEITNAPSNIIRTKGRVFTMPDGTSAQGPIKAVIVDFISANAFFRGAYNPTQRQKPVCWALGELATLRPSANATEPQNAGGDCASCPQNQWGTAQNGAGRGKACKNQMKIALIAADVETADPGKIHILNVSPTGIKVFSAFIRRVQKQLGHDALPIRVVTEISFDPLQAHPSLLFREVAINEKLGVALDLYGEAREMLMREPSAETEDT